mmetsp:Transcript_5456/g.13980  ORF Transcript_5456/g.13980 Transcript_5456/m.13980 type:complete len:86 (+) Transcript_5456:43-300(+)
MLGGAVIWNEWSGPDRLGRDWREVLHKPSAFLEPAEADRDSDSNVSSTSSGDTAGLEGAGGRRRWHWPLSGKRRQGKQAAQRAEG